jgi:membrane protein YqaA with SNARE-associated domain
MCSQLTEGGGAVSVIGTFLFCLLSAVVPIANAVVYLVGVSLATDQPAALLAAAAAAGQMAGKMAFYALGRGVIDVDRLRRKGTASGRWPERMARVRAWCERHAWGPTLVTAVSAFAGLPPFAVVSVLAGTLRMRWWLFLGVGIVGRFGRFLCVLLAPGLIVG